MLARWTQIAPAPRKTPLALRTAIGVWGGSWSFPIVWLGLLVFNVFGILIVLGGGGSSLGQFLLSTWSYYLVALCACTFTMLFSKRRKALREGDATIASLVNRSSKGSRWRVETTTGNSEFIVKGRKTLSDTLPVLLDSNRGKITSSELAQFADIDAGGNLVLARSLSSLVLTLPVLTYGSLIALIVAAIASA